MIVELSLETVVAVITVISAVNAAIFGLMNLLFVRRHSFYALRQKDEHAAELVNTEINKSINILEGRFRELETQHKILAEGPLKAVAATLTGIQHSLGELNAQSEERNERLITTLTNLDRRLIKVETKLVLDES